VVAHQIERNLGSEVFELSVEELHLFPGAGRGESVTPGAQTHGQQHVQIGVTLE
jgi:hypothetical protein